MAVQFAGGTYVSTTTTPTNRADLMAFLKANLTTAGWTAIAASAGWGTGSAGTVTITVASPGVFTMTGHGFLGGERVYFETTGALPTGITANSTVYFIKYIDANSFNISTSSGGSNVNTSGSQSGTHSIHSETLLMQSATQANVTNPIRVRIRDNNTVGIQVSIEVQSGSPAGGNSSGAGATIQTAAGYTYRFIATRYWFVLFPSGSLQGQNRDMVYAGMLYVPSFLSCTNIGLMVSNTHNSGDAGTRVTPMRGTSLLTMNSNYISNWQSIYNSSIIDNAQNAANSIGSPAFALPTTITTATGQARWANDDLNTWDPLVSVGLTAFTDEGKIHGQLFDAIYITTAFSLDSTDTFNGHNWFNLANNLAAGGIWLATS